MQIRFVLDQPHAAWLPELHRACQEAPCGPKFQTISDLCRALLEDMIADDFRDNAGDGTALN